MLHYKIVISVDGGHDQVAGGHPFEGRGNGVDSSLGPGLPMTAKAPARMASRTSTGFSRGVDDQDVPQQAICDVL